MASFMEHLIGTEKNSNDSKQGLEGSMLIGRRDFTPPRDTVVTNQLAAFRRLLCSSLFGRVDMSP